jgi:hypothetical protein
MKRYVYSVGRAAKSSVIVYADTANEADEKARAKLTRHAEKHGRLPPARWTLRLRSESEVVA